MNNTQTEHNSKGLVRKRLYLSTSVVKEIERLNALNNTTPSLEVDNLLKILLQLPET